MNTLCGLRNNGFLIGVMPYGIIFALCTILVLFYHGTSSVRTQDSGW
ncbi:hypothetical protein HTG_00120 [Natrinema mahii]|nr:hypothetical protein HTG_00120 [Natrinema mahii]